VLLARSPDGILGMGWLTRRVRLPFGDKEASAGETLLDREVARAA
jgi:hypothetical protein